MLEIDYREPEWIITKVMNMVVNSGFLCKSSLLERGDFIFSGKHKIAIERKGCDGDLIPSLANGRLQYQMWNMISGGDFDIAILGIEGFPTVDENGYLVTKGRTTGWKWVNILSILTSVQSMGVQVHWVPKEFYPHFILSQIKYWEKDSHNSFLNPPKPFPISLNDVKYATLKRILMSLPGMGEDTADRILNHYDQDVIEALSHPEDWTEVHGVGKKTVSKVVEVLSRVS